jgi:hypothetical protein
MGLAFVAITLVNLLFSAFSMVFKLGNGLKNSITKTNKNLNLSQKIFTYWDYHIIKKKFAKDKKLNLYKSIDVSTFSEFCLLIG